MADMEDDEMGLMSEMMSAATRHFEYSDEEPSPGHDITQTTEFSVDIRAIRQRHKSQAFKKSLCHLRSRLRSQLEHIRTKRFDSGDSSADESTLDWLEKLRAGGRSQRPAILPTNDMSSQDGQDAQDEDDELGDQSKRAVELLSPTFDNAIKCNTEEGLVETFRHGRRENQSTNFQSTHLISSESDDNVIGISDITKMLRQDREGVESSKEKVDELASLVREGSGSVSLSRSNAGEERQLTAETLGRLDAANVATERLAKCKEKTKENSTRHCELKRVVKDAENKTTFHAIKRKENTQTETSTTKETLEFVKTKQVRLPRVTREHQSALKGNVTTLIPKDLNVLESDVRGDDPQDLNKVREHLDGNTAHPSRLRELEKNANKRYVKMVGKLDGGKRRLIKRIPRRSQQQHSTSSSESGGESRKNSLENVLKKLGTCDEREKDEFSSFTNFISSRQNSETETMRLVKRICKRALDSEQGSNFSSEREENVHDVAREIPSNKRLKRDDSPNVVSEETVETILKKFKEKGTFSSRIYFRKRYRKKRFGRPVDDKESSPVGTRCSSPQPQPKTSGQPAITSSDSDSDVHSSRRTVGDLENTIAGRNRDRHTEDVAGTSCLPTTHSLTTGSSRTPEKEDKAQANDNPTPASRCTLRAFRLTADDDNAPIRPSRNQSISANQPALSTNSPLQNLKNMFHDRNLIGQTTTLSFLLLQKKSQNFIHKSFKVVFLSLIILLIIIITSFLVRVAFLCNPTDRCWKCDVELAFNQFMDTHGSVRHLKQPPI